MSNGTRDLRAKPSMTDNTWLDNRLLPAKDEFVRRMMNDNVALGPVLYHKLVTLFGPCPDKPNRKRGETSYAWYSDDFMCEDSYHSRGWFIGMYPDSGMMFLGTGNDDAEPLTDQRVLDLIEWCRSVGVQVFYKGEWITDPKPNAHVVSQGWHQRHGRRR